MNFNEVLTEIGKINKYKQRPDSERKGGSLQWSSYRAVGEGDGVDQTSTASVCRHREYSLLLISKEIQRFDLVNIGKGQSIGKEGENPIERSARCVFTAPSMRSR